MLVKHLTDRIALAILLASSVSMLLMLIPGQVGIWMKAHWIWPFLGFLLSLCYLPTRLLLDEVSERHKQHKRNLRLQNLTKKEKEILAPYIYNDFRSRRIFYRDPVAKGLVDDGVLSAPDVPPDGSGCVAYNIQDWVRLSLKKNLEWVGPSKSGPQGGDA